MLNLKAIPFVLLAVSLIARPQSEKRQPKAAPKDNSQSAMAQAEDISGMYSFVGEGEFLQINREDEGITGYISRMGDQESDRGSFLDQFFSKASVEGHNLTFTTKVLHGVWFEFKGTVERGPGKTKAQDGYYVLRGTLTEFIVNPNSGSSTSHSRQVAFRWLAQPDEELQEPKGQPKKK